MPKYKFKTKPYRHQYKALKKLLANGYGGALLMEPRTGKTKTSIDYMGILHQKHKVQKVLVVCPAKVMGVWLQEIHTHSPNLCNVIIWDAENRKKIQLPSRTEPYDITVVVVNFEAFATPGKRTPAGRESKTSGRYKVKNDIQKWIGQDRALCIIDESHKIKNPAGKTARMIVRMREMFSHHLILTGTPVTKAKRAHDIYMQWKFLNPSRFADLPTAEEFKNHYGKWLPRENYNQWVGPRNEDELKNRIAQDAFIVRREDCFDLPPREDVVQSIKLGKETSRVYDEMAEDMIARIKSGQVVEASIALVQLLRLAQITGGHAHTEDGGLHRVGTEKIDAIRTHFEDALERDEKLVVCARFKAELDACARLCTELGLKYWELRGGIPRAVTDDNIRQFKNWDDAGVFIMQPQAGSLGIDLRTSHKMIWFSLTNSFVDFSQACDRIALSDNPTTFVYLLANGTVDEVLYDSLQEDKDVAQRILSNPEILRRH